MRLRLPFFLLFALFALPLAGCEMPCATAPGSYAAPAPCAAPRVEAPCAGAPVAQADLLASMIQSGQVGVEWRVGARENARSFITVPPAALSCLVTGASEMAQAGTRALVCFFSNLIPPPPAPGLYLRAPAAPAAAPCR